MRSKTSKTSGGLIGVVWAAGAWGCESTGTNAPPAAPAPTAETVESRPGVVQAGDDDGPTLTEAETCVRFRDGVVRNRERLACDAPPLLACPELIRPLASLGCVTYSEASLTACLDAYDKASDCEGLLPGACILTAVLYELDPACAPDASVTGPAPSSGPPDGSTVELDGAVDTTARGDDAGTDGETTADSSAPPTTEDAATRPDAALEAGLSDAGSGLTTLTDGG